MTKTCSRCGVDQPLECFHSQHTVKSGRRSLCKACVQAYHQTAGFRALRRAQGRRYRQTHALQIRAHAVVKDMIRRGFLIPEPCRCCGAPAIAHHPDCSKPLDVLWLCQRHHRLIHVVKAPKELLAAQMLSGFLPPEMA